MEIDAPPKFVDLWTASTRIGSEVNLIGVVSDVLPAKKSSGTDWTCTFSIADRTHGTIGEVGQEGLKVRFFKKLQNELPEIWGTGDVVILRNMKIKQFNGMTLAISAYGTTWTVMHASSIPDNVPSNLVQLPHIKETKAPTPVPSEIEYSIDLCNYFDRSSYTSKEAPTNLSSSEPFSTATTSNMLPRQKFSLVKDVQIATYYDLVGQVVKIHPSNGRTDLYITDYTPNQLLYFYQWGQDEDELDAREGDEYGYVSRSSKNTKKWPGPFGKLTLAVTLWEPHSQYAQANVKEGDFVYLRNTHIRLDKDAKMVASLHEDRRFADRIQISVLTDFHDDDRVKDVLRRKRDYHKKFDQQSEKYVIEARQTMKEEVEESRPIDTEECKALSKTQIKKRRKQERGKSHIAQGNSNNLTCAKRKCSEDETENNPPFKVRSKPAISPAEASKPVSGTALNENIKCSHHLTPTTPLSTILSLDMHSNTSPAGTTYTLPFQNINSRATVRVVDFYPSRLEDFVVPKKKRSEYSVLSDYDDSDHFSSDDASITLPRNLPPASPAESRRGDDLGPGDRAQEWEWRFALLLEDAKDYKVPPEERVKLKAYVSGPDAECLLKLDAENLRDSPVALAALRERLFLLWGDLEERKIQEQTQESKALREIGSNIQFSGTINKVETKGRPFQCCLKEYGVKVRTEIEETRSDGHASGGEDSEEGKDLWQWDRRWRMWGCTIT